MPSRRRLLAASASAVAAGSAGCLGGFEDPARPEPGTDENSDWPLPDYDAVGSSYARDAAAPRSSPSERFAVEVDWPHDRPVVAGGTVYLPTADALVALDAGDGTERWRYAPSPERTDTFRSPAVHDGTVYVTGDPGLVALDAADGSEQWTLPAESGVQAPVAVAPEWEALFVGDRNGTVARVALDGTVEWRVDVFGEVTRLVAGIRGVHVGTSGGEVYRLYDGRGLWRKRVPGMVSALASEDGGDAFVSTWGGGVLRLSDGWRAGEPRWHAEDGPVAQRGFAVSRQGVYGADYSGIARLQDRTGEQRWDLGGEFKGAPAAAGDTVYVAGDGEVAAYKFGGGFGSGSTRLEPRRWTYDLGDRSGGHVAVADGALFVPLHMGEKGDPGLVALE